jgi:6,7-dimethyl-8-ribityllumazine synthase
MTPQPRILVVEARFYEDLADQLAEGACAVLAAAGAAIERHTVPGCFELPTAIRFALGDDPAAVPFDGAVALGCVIRGETDHYDHICREVSRALMDLSVGWRLPLGFGVLTCPSYELARVRAAVDGKNKGAEAAHACLAMIALKHRLLAGGR